MPPGRGPGGASGVVSVLIRGLGWRLLRGRWLVITLVVLLAAGVMVRLGFGRSRGWMVAGAANAAIT